MTANRHVSRSARALAAAAFIGVPIAGCGGGSPTSSGPPPSAAASTVRIASFAYSPATLAVKRGATVTFVNHDTTPHTVTADGGSFDSGSLTQGEQKTITFRSVGTFTYHCAFHPFMRGTVIVR